MKSSFGVAESSLENGKVAPELVSTEGKLPTDSKLKIRSYRLEDHRSRQCGFAKYEDTQASFPTIADWDDHLGFEATISECESELL